MQIIYNLFPNSHLQSYLSIPTEEWYLNQMPTYQWLNRVLANGRPAQGLSHHLIYVRCPTSSRSGYGQCPDNSKLIEHSSIAHHFERVASSTLAALLLSSLPFEPPSPARSIVRLGETRMARQSVLYATKNRKHHFARTHPQLRILRIRRCIMAPFFLVISRVPLYQKHIA